MSMTISGQPANVFRIPTFLAAPTLDELRRLMLLNNLKNHMEFKYSPPQWDVKSKRYITWFNFEVDKNSLVRESLNGDS